MKRILWLVLPIVAISIAAPVLAGEGHGKCEGTAQACLDMMVTEWKGKGWMGVELEYVDNQLAIARVVEDSPADKAGFKTGDVLFAINDVRYDAEDKTAMKALKKTMVVGATFAVTLHRKGKPKMKDVTLGEMPGDLLAKMVGGHMLEGHANVEHAEEE